MLNMPCLSRRCFGLDLSEQMQLFFFILFTVSQGV